MLHFVPTKFMILDTGNREDTALILARPFLLLMLVYLWILDKFISTLLERKRDSLFLVDRPLRMQYRQIRDDSGRKE